jgi:hypothetical protein
MLRNNDPELASMLARLRRMSSEEFDDIMENLGLAHRTRVGQMLTKDERSRPQQHPSLSSKLPHAPVWFLERVRQAEMGSPPMSESTRLAFLEIVRRAEPKVDRTLASPSLFARVSRLTSWASR